MMEALRRPSRQSATRFSSWPASINIPFSLACALMGVERVMMQPMDDRPLVDALMEKCGEYAVAYAKALAAAGADMLSGGDSPAGLIGPRLYHEVALAVGTAGHCGPEIAILHPGFAAHLRQGHADPG